MQTVEIGTMEFGRDQAGRRTALVTFVVTAEDDPLPNPQDFKVEIFLADAGDPTAVAAVAKKRFHQLMLDLAEATAMWA